MAKQQRIKKPNFPAHVDSSVFIADVPVKIAFKLGEETLQEYDDIIDLKFDTNTPAGRQRGQRIAILKTMDGHTTESALFKIASDEIHTHAVEMLQTLANTNVVKRASGHKVHLHVKRNGDITYRMPVKE